VVLGYPLVGLAVVLATHVVAAAERPAHPDPIAVVVGRESFVREMTLDTLREIYLRRQRLWPNGAATIPINVPAGNPLRERFSTRVLGRSSRDLVAYWNGRYFDGIRPPIVLPSAAAVRAYVAAEPAAVGYLPLAEVDDSCRVLLTLPPP
jgi:ABC-type phosphate transport system substrate-binding protein